MMTLFVGLRAFCRRLVQDRRGNALMIFGFALGPMLFATGMAVDYSKAARLRTKLNAIADAAALAAVTQPMMIDSTTNAKAIATAMFDQQVAAVVGLKNSTIVRNVVVIESAPGLSSNTSRTAKVTYSAESLNAFSGVLGKATIAIGGDSEATASLAPDTDFYMLVDTSPSMELPATSAGIAKMKSLTPTQGDNRGCAFACHQSDRNDGRISRNPWNYATGMRMDNYELARKYNIVLRTDLVTAAVKNLTSAAQTAAESNKATYRMALAAFDVTYRNIVQKPSNLTSVAARADKAVVPIVCRHTQRVCDRGGDDTSYFYNAFNGASANLPLLGGNGTRRLGDTPQALLFIVTDGLRHDNGGIGPISTAICSVIKTRNIRIAILYTQYLPESVNDVWSVTNVQSKYLLPKDLVAPALSECASPGLFYQVTTDGDISAAMETLFRRAISSAHLTE